MRKTVYFEGLGLVEGHFSGIGQYILGVLRGVDEIIERETLAGNNPPRVKVIIPYDTLPKFNSYRFKYISAKRFPLSFSMMARLWHRGMMPPLDLYCGRGYYVFTRFVTMPLVFSDSSVIIYDLSYEHYRQFSDERNAQFLSKFTKKSVEQVSDIFTISQNAKREIVDFYKAPANNVHVATPAADQGFFYRRSGKEIEEAKREYGIEGDYILALSNLEPRKNLETLVDAYCALPKSYRDKVSLLLVGVSGWKTDKLFTKIVDLVNQGYAITRPNKYVTDEDRAAIISGASMLVYPSHYEGFGMPPLEALACGVPVVTADNSSLPEVVSGVGTMLECTDTKGFTKEIQKTLDNLKKGPPDTITTGPQKAEEFSWQKSADVYWKKIMEKVS